jgi:hypothetical protein
MLAMEARMRTVLGWLRRRLGVSGSTPARSRKRPGRGPSTLESLERREVLSTATVVPFATPLGAAVSTLATSTAAVAPASSTTPTSTVPVSSVAPVSYAGQPIVAASAGGISATDMDDDYVQALYRTVLDRVGQPGEVAGWVGAMKAGMTIPEVALSFVDSIEHRQDEVDSYYEEFLHRTPDANALLWVDDLVAGASEEDVTEAILDSPEYQAAHQDPGTFIQGLSQDVLGRATDPAGYAYWDAALASGESRQAVVASFVTSPEVVDQVIDGFYEGYLHREPDVATSTPWVNMLETTNGSATNVAVGILSSAEFIQDSQQP